jgi:hypothetical protein
MRQVNEARIMGEVLYVGERARLACCERSGVDTTPASVVSFTRSLEQRRVNAPPRT